MPIRKLTDAAIRSIKPTPTQTDYWTPDLPGFGLRVSPAGRKVFVLRYRVNGTRQRRMTLGAYPALSLTQARTRARRVLGEVANAGDPAQAKQDSRHGVTFGDLGAQYLEKWAKVRKKSWREDRRILENELSAWGTRQASEIRRRDVRDLVEAIAERGAPIMANRVLATVRKVFNWGIGRDLVEHNPCAQLERPGKERQRDRVLSEAEIRRLWKSLDTEPPAVAALFRLRLATAARGGEVAGMQWSEIDLAECVWTVPAARSKNGLAHRVPLAPLVLKILTALHPKDRRAGYVLAGARGKRQRADVVKAVGLPNFVPHDLRRTAASSMASAGVPRVVIGKILNHVEPGVTAVYDRHGYDAEKRRALEAWARTLDAIVTGKKRQKVVSIGRA